MLPPPAPRDMTEACAQYLARSDFAYRWDAPAKTWRRLPEALAVDFGEVRDAAMEHLDAALRAPVPPMVFRCVFADPHEADRLDTVTDWAADTQALHDQAEVVARLDWERNERRKAAERAELEALLATDPATNDLAARLSRRDAPRRLADLAPSDFRWDRTPPPVVSPDRRDRWLRNLSAWRGRETVYRASDLPALRYIAPSRDADFERDWLRSLPRVPGATVAASDLLDAYREACPPGVQPLHDRALVAIACEPSVLGPDCRKRTKRGFVYVDLALPGLRLVEDLPDTA